MNYEWKWVMFWLLFFIILITIFTLSCGLSEKCNKPNQINITKMYDVCTEYCNSFNITNSTDIVYTMSENKCVCYTGNLKEHITYNLEG